VFLLSSLHFLELFLRALQDHLKVSLVVKAVPVFPLIISAVTAALLLPQFTGLWNLTNCIAMDNFLLLCLQQQLFHGSLLMYPFGVEVKVTFVLGQFRLHSFKVSLPLHLLCLSWQYTWTICYSGYCRWTYYNIWSYCTTIWVVYLTNGMIRIACWCCVWRYCYNSCSCIRWYLLEVFLLSFYISWSCSNGYCKTI
jgi:hypothetical protein